MRTEKQFNEQEAILFTASILTRKKLIDKLTCQLGTLFKENRRATETPYTRKHGITRKGNRHIYGKIPFVVRSGKAFYPEMDLRNWIAATLIPMLEAA